MTLLNMLAWLSEPHLSIAVKIMVLGEYQTLCVLDEQQVPQVMVPQLGLFLRTYNCVSKISELMKGSDAANHFL